MSEPDNHPLTVVPPESEFSAPVLIDKEFASLIISRGRKEGRNVRIRGFIIGLCLGVLPMNIPIPLQLSCSIFVISILLLAWLVGWYKTALVSDALKRRRYDELSSALPRAVGWNRSFIPVTWFNLLSCLNSQFLLLMLEGRSTELEALAIYSWGYSEPGGHEKMPEKVANMVLLGTAFVLQTRYENATELFQAVLARKPGMQMRSIALNNLAYSMVKNNQAEEAEIYLNEAWKLNGPKFETLRGMRLRTIKAMILIAKNQDLDFAENEIEHARATAIKLQQPSDYQAAYDALLAEIRCKQGHLDEAELYFRNAIDMSESADNPDYLSLAKYCRSYAEILAQTNRHDAAADQISRARAFYDFYVRRETESTNAMKNRLMHSKRITIGTELLENAPRIKSIEMDFH